MARTKTTWQKGQGGKPPGAKDTVPRSFKKTLLAVYEDIQSSEPDIVRDAVRKGLRGRPKEAFNFVKLYADLMGELKQKVELSGNVTVSDDQLADIRQQLDELAAQHARGGPASPSLAD